MRARPLPTFVLAAITIFATLIVLPASPAQAATVTYSATQTIPVPPASTYAGSGGGDGWGVGLTATDVYNVFHHSNSYVVACHHQSDGSPCWSPMTLSEPGGSGFSAGSQPGVWIDPTTERLYGFATRVSDQTAGVVCFDTRQAASGVEPYCGFTTLSAVGDSSLEPGFSTISNPVKTSGKWFAFNFFNNAGVVGTKNKLLCFDPAKLTACTGQPFALNFNQQSLSGSTYPSPSITSLGSRVVAPARTASGDLVACFDSGSNGDCAGQWPLSTGLSAVSNYGAPFDLLDTVGNPIGFCFPDGSGKCWDLGGSQVQPPAKLTSAITANSGWDGPGVVLGPRVYVPNGNTNQVQCFDFANSTTCANFPKSLANLSLLYSVTLDPLRPTCLWVNSDNGSGQIQNFDAYSGGACGQGPIRVLASSFIVPTQVCQPATYTSIQVTSPQRSAYTSGTVAFQDNNATPIVGAADRPLDGSGTADLSGLNLSTSLGLPQFLITLVGAGGAPTSVAVKLTWTGTDDPSCVLPGTVVNGQIQDGCTDVVVIAAMGSGQYYTKQDDLSPSPQLTTLYGAIKERASSKGKTVSVRVVNYPATSVDALWAGLKSTKNKVELVKKLRSNAAKYIAGEKQGVAQLGGLITGAEWGCRNSSLVLIGYSQGAMVIHDWVNEPGRTSHPAIVGLGLLADPERVDNSGVLDFGSADFINQNLIGSHGVCAQVNAAVNCASPAALADISPTFRARAVSVCEKYDLVCDTGTVVNAYPVNTQSGRSTLLNLAKFTHGTYSWLPATKTAGKWLGNKV